MSTGSGFRDDVNEQSAHLHLNDGKVMFSENAIKPKTLVDLKVLDRFKVVGYHQYNVQRLTGSATTSYHSTHASDHSKVKTISAHAQVTVLEATGTTTNAYDEFALETPSDRVDGIRKIIVLGEKTNSTHSKAIIHNGTTDDGDTVNSSNGMQYFLNATAYTNGFVMRDLGDTLELMWDNNLQKWIMLNHLGCEGSTVAT
jgi:hypothetical protein